MISPKKPVVKHDILEFENTNLPVGSMEWYDWISANRIFRFEGEEGDFSARREKHGNHTYWYAYRRRGGKLFKTYLGKSKTIDHDSLEEASRALTEAEFRNNKETRVAPTESPRIDSSYLPKTKLTAPVLPQKLLKRPRLNQQICTPLTLLYAPSGFGKTTLVNDWSRSCDFPVAWLSLDKQDNQPLHFWHSMVATLQTIDPNIGEDVRQYLQTSPSSVKIPALIALLTNDITQEKRLGLVIDDFHHIHSSVIFDFLQAFFEYIPPNLRLVLSGNIKPPLLVGELRAKSMVTELGANDLRFSLEEGIDYLQMFTENIQISQGDLERLARHTEGWAVGLTLTALALTQQKDLNHFASTFSGTHIYFREYFMEAVHRQLDPEMQSFLLKTSILKHLTGSLCDAITGRTDGKDTLAKLCRENQLILQLEEPGWYRYHDLFAEMLNDQFKSRYPSELVELHQSAAKWFNEHGAPSDAISHLLAARAWEEAAALITDTALRELEVFGEDSRLLRWLNALPETIFQQHKNLLFVYLQLAIIALPQKDLIGLIHRIETNIRQIPPSKQTKNQLEVLENIVRIREGWRNKASYPVNFQNEEEQNQSWGLLRNLHWLKIPPPFDMNYVENKIHRLFQEAQREKNLFMTLMAGTNYIQRLILHGQLNLAEKTAHHTIKFVLDMRDSLPETASMILLNLSTIYYEHHELTLAKDTLARAIHIDPNPTSTNLPIAAGILRAKIQTSEEKFDEALSTLQSLKELQQQRPSGIWETQDLLAYEAMINERSGNLEQTQRIISEMSDLQPNSLTRLAKAIYLLSIKESKKAEKILETLIEDFPYGLSTEPLARVRIPLALALLELNNIYQARQVITESIRLSAHEQMMQPYLEYGTRIIPLLMLMLNYKEITEEAESFVKNIIDLLASSYGTEKQQHNPEIIKKLTMAGSITEREQEVLSLLSRGYSNRDIAEQLFVCESTIKTHLSNIYQKLDVNNRLLATARADELGLV